jgi:hypothetical protein
LADLGGAATAIAAGLSVGVAVLVAATHVFATGVMVGLSVAAGLVTFGIALHLLGPRLRREPPQVPAARGRPRPGTDDLSLRLRRASRLVWVELAEGRALVGRMQAGMDLWDRYKTRAWSANQRDMLDLAAPTTFRLCAEAYRALDAVERLRDEPSREIDPGDTEAELADAADALDAAIIALQDEDR